MRHLRNRLRVAALTFAVPLFGDAALAAESVTLKFAPPVDQRFLEREIHSTELRIGNNKEVTRIASLLSVRVFRKGSSIHVGHRIEEMAASKDGGGFETPPQVAALRGHEIVHVLSADGTLVRVDGYRESAEKALPHMQGEAKKSLEKYLAEGKQLERDRASWYEVEMLVGQELELERDYWFDSAWSEDRGWIPYQTLLRAGPWVNHPVAGRLLTVNMAYVPNALARVPGATKLAPKVASRFDPLKPGKFAPGEKLDGASTWLVDPATLLTWKISARRKVSQPMQVSSDLGVTLVAETVVEKTLEPAPAKR